MELYRGTVITSEDRDHLRVTEGAYVAVERGVIAEVYETLPPELSSCPVTDYGRSLIIPAFSDHHIHAPQYRERGLGMDCLLFDWLNTYTFPEEAKFEDLDYARTIYAQVIRDLLANGTAHASLFTTIHYEASDLIFRMLKKSGMYAFSGKVNMDRNSPDFLVEETEVSLAETERFVAEHLGDDHVQPILTPRFAPTCSEQLLKGLGEIGQKYQVGLQTHLVESRAEAQFAKELFPQYGSDGAIYEGCGLLGNGPAIFAHVIFPTQVELDLLKKYNAVSVHCPDSTTNITAGIMPVSDLLAQGLRLTVGSDVGGGQSMGAFTQIGRAIQLSKLKEFYEPEYHRIGLANAFWMATAEGGSLFGKAGKIEKGYRFDALVLDPMEDAGVTHTPLESLERFCYLGTAQEIQERFIDGKKVDPQKVYQELLEM